MVHIVGGGIAGCEAAFQLGERGIDVTLYEMRPLKRDEAHKTDLYAELVCSNSLRGKGIGVGVGVLKEELVNLKSLFMEGALFAEIPSGGAWGVNREVFSNYITKRVRNHPHIICVEKTVEEIPKDGITIIATGPLSEGSLYDELRELMGSSYAHFYDGAAPIVSADSIDYEKVFFASRYGKGDGDVYLNCPMDEATYDAFYDFLVNAPRVIPHLDSEKKETYFEGCMPMEVLAKRGKKTLLFGALKPVGLEDPVTGKRYHAVLQLRPENKEKEMYNLVGCQTGLTFPAQKELMTYIPGLEKADILRYGVVHRNSYVNGPQVMLPTGGTKMNNTLYIAGQLSGVEGYVESAASGYVTGLNVYRFLTDKSPIIFPKKTMIGAMMEYISTAEGKNFQPMNANFGLLPPLEERIKDKKLKKETLGKRCLDTLKDFMEENEDAF